MAENVDYGLGISESNQEFMILPDKVKVRSRSKGSTSVFLVNVGMFECLNVGMLECWNVGMLRLETTSSSAPLPLCVKNILSQSSRDAKTQSLPHAVRHLLSSSLCLRAFVPLC